MYAHMKLRMCMYVCMPSKTHIQNAESKRY